MIDKYTQYAIDNNITRNQAIEILSKEVEKKPKKTKEDTE